MAIISEHSNSIATEELTVGKPKANALANDKIVFTEKRVAELPKPIQNVKRAIHHDKQTRGFCVAISPAGKRTFMLYRSIRNRPERIIIGHSPDMSVLEARKRADELNGLIAKGENPADGRRDMRAAGTLQDAFDRFLELHAKGKKKPRSIHDDKANFGRYLSVWKDRELGSIRKSDVARLHSELGERNGKVTANRVLALLSTVFNKALHFGWNGKNPCVGIDKFAEESRERTLNDAELKRFMLALAEETHKAFRDWVLLLLLTACRASNVLFMSWADVDLHSGVWRIPASQGKSNKPQHVALTESTLSILKRRRQSARGPWVFPGSDPAKSMTTFVKPWNALLLRAGIENFHVHDIRRTAASIAARQGVPMKAIQKTLGHATMDMTSSVYTVAADSDSRAALAVVEQRVLEAGLPSE